MFKAICWKCGEKKTGEFLSCPRCSAIPTREEELMISLLLTDHNLGQDRILDYQQAIRDGANIVLDEQAKNQLRPFMSEAFLAMRAESGALSSIPPKGFARLSRIRPVKPMRLGQMLIGFSYLTVSFVLYFAVKIAFTGNPLAFFGALGYFWMINTASIMTSSIIHRDYEIKFRLGQLLVGIIFLILSFMLMYVGNYDRIIIFPDSLSPVKIFLWIVAPVLGISIGLAGGGRTKRN